MKSSLRQEQKDRTRERILRAATEAYARLGLTAATTASVAEAAAVAHGTVFSHFPTQEILLAAVIEEFGGKVAGRLHELATGGCSVREILEAHLRGLVEFEQFYTRLVVEGPLLPESAKNALIMIQSAVAFHLAQVAEAGLRAGGIRPMPLHLLFNTWIGLVHYYLANRELFAPGGSVLKRYGEELIDHYVALVSVEPVKAPRYKKL